MPVYYNFDPSGAPQAQQMNAYYQQPFNNNYYQGQYPMAANAAPMVLPSEQAPAGASQQPH